MCAKLTTEISQRFVPTVDVFFPFLPQQDFETLFYIVLFFLRFLQIFPLRGGSVITKGFKEVSLVGLSSRTSSYDICINDSRVYNLADLVHMIPEG